MNAGGPGGAEEAFEESPSRIDRLLGADPDADAEGDGERLGDYRLLLRLGGGAMGVVWLAEDVRHRRRVALKVLAPHLRFDAEAVWRFGQEATAGARLSHPHVVPVFASGEADGVRFIAMEFVEGRGLDEVLHGARDAASRPGPAAPRDAARWIREAAEGLAHAHDRGVLHRDLKPSNLLLDAEGSVRIVDFGLARIDDEAPITRTGAFLGTLPYMAPEALRGRRSDQDARADIYSLGAVLFEALTGRPPFGGDSPGDLLAELERGDAPSPRKWCRTLPRDLEAVVGRCLARDRADRYATARDLAEDLGRFLEDVPVRARPPGPLRRIAALVRRRPAAAGALLAASAAAVAVPFLLAGAARARVREEAARARTAGLAAVEVFRSSERKLDDLRRELEVLERRLGNLDEFAVAIQDRDDLWLAGAALRKEAERALEQARAHLEQAARLEAGAGGLTGETRAALLDYHVFRHRRAEEGREGAAAAAFAAEARRLDPSPALEARLRPPGSLAVTVDPPAATLHLFRYEPHEAHRTDVRVPPRLVPVPVDVDDPDARALPTVSAGFVPGDPCLEVLRAEPGSPAARAGVGPGDLVIRLQDRACGEGLFIASVAAGGPAAAAGVLPGDRVERFRNAFPRRLYDWARYGARHRDAPFDLDIGGRRLRHPGGGDVEAALGFRVAEAPALLGAAPLAGPVRLVVLRGGAPVTVDIPKGVAAGLDVAPTAYPLLRTAASRLPANRPLPLPPGSYLLLAEHEGRAPLRFPVVVPRGGAARVDLRLLPFAAVPEGYVWIPPGPFPPPFDPDRPPFETPFPRTRDLPGFLLRKTEVTAREYFEFLNAPATRALLDAARARGETILLPRHYGETGGEPLYRVDADGRYVPARSAEAPVLGISRNDVDAYLGWWNREAAARGDPRRLHLPTGAQLQKAAAGVDGRIYPWGDEFSPALCHNYLRRDTGFLHDAPPGYEPRDASPFGVLDLAGSRMEWSRDGLHGGSWGDAYEALFRNGRVGGIDPGYVNWTLGFRTVVDMGGSGEGR
jgi:formylglycine-generating enzyme required for sulfatase activity